jgi:hypothetical protein
MFKGKAIDRRFSSTGKSWNALGLQLCVWVLFALAFPRTVHATENPLLVAVRLAEIDFNGWAYGHRLAQREINCVQFVAAVVEDLLGRKLEKNEEEILFVKHVGRSRNVKRLIRRNDGRIKGVQTALIAMGKGESVEPAEAAPGDFVQFWRQHNGRWFGHTGIIINVENRAGRLCALLFGAHQSLNGVGVGGFELGLNDPTLRVYVVRLKS